MTSTTATMPTQTPALKMPPTTAQPLEQNRMINRASGRTMGVRVAFMQPALAEVVPSDLFQLRRSRHSRTIR